MPKYSQNVATGGEKTVFVPTDEGAYYHPMAAVYLVDADSESQITYRVPAIFVKAISDEAEWNEIELNIRIGADILAIILGIATLGTGNAVLAVAEIHTNFIEGAWKIMKNSLRDMYNSVSRKHLQSYVDEFVFRYNTRQIKSGERFNYLLLNSQIRTKYKDLINA